MNLVAAYLHYVETLTGTAPALKPVKAAQAGPLPLYLRSYYDLRESRLFGRPTLLAFQNPDADTATPTEYAQHYAKLCAVTGQAIALVLPRIGSHGRQRLVQLGVPFVVPNRQAFLPALMVDLHEHFPRPAHRATDALSAAAQVVILRHLLGKPVQGVSLRELAKTLGYSAMTLSNVRHELEAFKLCRAVPRGRSAHLVFPEPMRTLWDRALPHLATPVKARHWVRFGWTGRKPLQAGLAALAAVSMVSDDNLKTFAITNAEYRLQVKAGNLVECEEPDDAQAQVECWRYDPGRLSDGPFVDPLSLYLSLRTTDDERVAKALKTLLGSLPW